MVRSSGGVGKSILAQRLTGLLLEGPEGVDSMVLQSAPTVNS